jgi:phosphoglycerate dehydrogenase-like enzyme
MTDATGFKLVMLPPQTDVARGWAGQLMAEIPGLRLAAPETEAEALPEMADADACYGFLTPPLLAAARRLRWLQAPFAAPPAGYYYPALVEHPLVATNFREIYNDHIGAHVMAFVLAFARGFEVFLPQQVRGEWRPQIEAPPIHLPETTALIVGLGGIGVETARLLAAFGVTVLATDARRAGAVPHVAELHPPQALDALLPRADFVILTIPHTPATEGLFDRARFRRMKPSAIFINIGRGMTTRLDDLGAAIEAGEIGGAGLDVYEQEPLPQGHPLWTLPRVLLTPHVAWRGPYLDERRYQILADNCRAFAAGAPLRNLVDKAAWF